MAKVTYTNLKLKADKTVKTFTFNDSNIEVLQYLPVEDKYDLIMNVVQKSKQESIYNPLFIDVFFHLGLVYLYTNISFTDKQREDEFKLFDTLKSSGLLGKILEAIPQSEYQELYDYICVYSNDDIKYNDSLVALLKKVISDLPKNAETAAKIVETFDREKYQNVIDFANAANGYRNFKTNQPIEPPQK